MRNNKQIKARLDEKTKQTKKKCRGTTFVSNSGLFPLRSTVKAYLISRWTTLSFFSLFHLVVGKSCKLSLVTYSGERMDARVCGFDGEGVRGGLGEVKCLW